jgi:MFS family permease
MALSTLGRALAHRNFRLFILGQGVSLIGTWMQQVALAWVVFEQTGSPDSLGVVGFAGQAPALFLAPVAGVLVDRWNRHRLILLTQTLAMLQAFAVAALVLADAVSVPAVALLSLFLGVINVFDMTARQAFLTEMVDRREDLANAIALNSSMVNGARLVGPALAGLLLARAGAAVCFLLNGFSYLAVLAALLAMRLAPRPPARARTPLWQGLHEGLRYAIGFGPIRALVLLLALVSLMASAYSVLLPVFAKDVLHGGAEMLGWLGTASGVGALAAAVRLASRRSVLGLGRWVAWAPIGFGLGLVGFALSRWPALSILALAAVGFSMMAQMAASNTLLQTIVEEDKRGRVMSLYTLAFLGMAPLGSLLGGRLASTYGAQWTVGLAGVCCVAGSLVFMTRLPRLRQEVRPIYRRLGILPEMAAGLQAAAEPTVPPEER